MAHKFEPADDKYWTEQRLKHQAAAKRYYQEKAAKTNFTDLFIEEPQTNTPKHQK